MYDFKDFVSNVREELSNKYPDVEVVVKDILKNNDVTLTAVEMNRKDMIQAPAPAIYMDSYYSSYRAGANIEDIISAISHNYEESIKNVADIDEKSLNNVSNYFIKLVNKDSNKRYLADAPYIKYNDLALTLRCLIRKDENNVASAGIKNSLIEELDISKEELFKVAMENTKRLFPPVLRKINDVLSEAGIIDPVLPDNNLYVLSNECGVNGATVMLYDDVIKDFVKTHGECYVIPSSIHEVLLLPKNSSDIDLKDMKMFVKQVNSMSVPEQDFLSDNVYMADENGISIAGEMEKEDYMDM